MNVKTAKTKSCPKCGHTIILNAWGIPTKRQSGDYMDAIERAKKKLEKELDFGIKEEHESNGKTNKKSQGQSKKNRKKTIWY